jgi:3-hydroxyisobutyrate dehydrogenase-like beta-hydroxyacid dehydrogenase
MLGKIPGAAPCGVKPSTMNVQGSGAKIVAVLGLGEAGSLLARDQVRGGATVRGWDPDFHGDLSEIPLADSFADAVRGADIIVSVNWATVAADVAREAVPFLRRGVLYADHNTAGPTLKEELAAIVEPAGAAFIDVAMMAPVPPLGMKVGMFMAGSGAEALAAYYRTFGTPVGFIGTKPGDANGRKLCRSVFFKGMSSSVWEALEAARAAGVEEWLHADIARTFVEAGNAFIDRLVDGTSKHAVRRAHEMRDAETMLRELGTPTTMVTATAESLERIAREKQVLSSR